MHCKLKWKHKTFILSWNILKMFEIPFRLCYINLFMSNAYSMNYDETDIAAFTHLLITRHQSSELPLQKQPFIGVFIKTCLENVQQIYRRTPMPKCGNFIDITLRHGYFPVHLLHISRIVISKNPARGLFLLMGQFWVKKLCRTDIWYFGAKSKMN